MHQHVYLEALAVCAVEQPSFHRLALKTLVVADLQAPPSAHRTGRACAPSPSALAPLRASATGAGRLLALERYAIT
jgi:hypothetical protein